MKLGSGHELLPAKTLKPITGPMCGGEEQTMAHPERTRTMLPWWPVRSTSYSVPSVTVLNSFKKHLL